MNLVHILVDDIGKVMRMRKDDVERFHYAVRLCEAAGCVRAQEVRQMAEIGIPVVSIAASMLKINATEAFGKFKDTEVTYQDLLCILGAFAQDLMMRSQTSKYNG